VETGGGGLPSSEPVRIGLRIAFVPPPRSRYGSCVANGTVAILIGLRVRPGYIEFGEEVIALPYKPEDGTAKLAVLDAGGLRSGLRGG